MFERNGGTQMSRYFAFIDGKAYDFKFKKHYHDNWTLFYLGEHHIATLIKATHRAGWIALVTEVEDRLQTPSKVEGFVSRRAAIDYALMTHVKTRDSYNTDRATEIHEREFLAKKAES
jgi:hypothetical protein